MRKIFLGLLALVVAVLMGAATTLPASAADGSGTSTEVRFKNTTKNKANTTKDSIFVQPSLGRAYYIAPGSKRWLFSNSKTGVSIRIERGCEVTVTTLTKKRIYTNYNAKTDRWVNTGKLSAAASRLAPVQLKKHCIKW